MSRELEQYLSVKQVAARLACSTRTVWRRVAEGLLSEPKRFGGLTRWREDDVVKSLRRMERSGAQ